MTKQDAAKWLELDYLPRLSASRKDCANGCDVCRGMHQTDDYCDLEMLQNVLAMLKEQEAVPVIQREVMHMLVWCCGSCGVPITSGDKFCRMCGKAVKWE